MDVVDNHEDATIGAFFLCDLVQNIANAEDLDDDIEDILQEFEGKSQREILHTVLFYWGWAIFGMFTFVQMGIKKCAAFIIHQLHTI